MVKWLDVVVERPSIFAALEAVHATDRAANHGCVCCWKAGEREDHNWK